MWRGAGAINTRECGALDLPRRDAVPVLVIGRGGDDGATRRPQISHRGYHSLRDSADPRSVNDAPIPAW